MTEEEAAREVARRTEGKLEPDNAAAPAALIAVISEVADSNGRRRPPAELAARRAEIAALLLAEARRRRDPAAKVAERAAATLEAAARIAAREDEICELIGAGGETEAPIAVDATTLASDLLAVHDEAATVGASLSHDSWFAASIKDTVKGPPNDELSAMGRKIRARPTMAPSNELVESADRHRIKELDRHHADGVERAFAAIVDSLAGGIPRGTQSYTEAVKRLPDPFPPELDPSPAPHPSTLRLLRRIGFELDEARAMLLCEDPPDWDRLPRAKAALAAVHDRYVQANPDAAPEQRVPFEELSCLEQGRDVPVLMAAVYGALAAMRAVPGLKGPNGSEKPRGIASWAELTHGNGQR